MLRKFILGVYVVLFGAVQISSCTQANSLTLTAHTIATQTKTLSSTPTITQTGTSTASATPDPTVTLTVTPTPTRTAVPTPTATPLGGGTGLIQIQSCKNYDFMGGFDCTKLVFSLAEMQIIATEAVERPEFREIEIKEFKHRLDMVDPITGESKTVLECPQEYDGCGQTLLYGSVEEEWVYITLGSDPVEYDGEYFTDLYKVNTLTGESIAVDHVDGYIWPWFNPFPGELRGLLSVNESLLIYDLETRESQMVAESDSQFYRFGYSPDLSTF